MLRKLITFNAESKELNRLMDYLDLALNPVLSADVLDFNIVKNVSLTVGDNVVDHRLGRAPIGWFIVRKRGAGNFYDKQDSNALAAKNCIINSDSIVTVDIYFF